MNMLNFYISMALVLYREGEMAAHEQDRIFAERMDIFFITGCWDVLQPYPCWQKQAAQIVCFLSLDPTRL